MLPASYMVKKFGVYVVVDIVKKNRSKQSVTRFLSGGAYWGMVFGPWTDRAGVSSPIPLCANIMQLETSIYNWTAILLYAIGTLTSLYSGFFLFQPLTPLLVFSLLFRQFFRGIGQLL